MKKKSIKLFKFLVMFSVLFACNQEKKDWEKTKMENTQESLKRFLLKYPTGKNSLHAKQLIDSINYYQWPPEKLENIPGNYSATESLSFNEWENVEFRGSERMAFIIKHANLRINENIFSPEKIEEGLAQSQFEVIYYDDNQTFIKVDSLKNDKMLFIYLGPGQFQTTFNVPGTTVKYQNKTYRLKEDGWYLDKKRIHEFQNNN